MARSGRAAAVALAMVVCLAGGLAAGVWLTRTAVPEQLQEADELVLAPVSERSYGDSRTVALTVQAQDDQALGSPRDGRVSASSCAPGSQLKSGASALALDGAGVLALATAVPLWRDLAVGDIGKDAAALNAELARLGFDAPDSQRITSATVRAYRAAAKKAGAAEPRDSVIVSSQILWLPAAEVTVAACPARLGDTIAAGDQVLVLHSSPDVRITSIPSDGVEGARVLEIDTETIPVGTDGQVTDPEALATLLESDAYAASGADETGLRQLSVKWTLAEPIQVSVVPPSAVVGAGTDHACVVAGEGATHPVRIVGSELGQTYVSPLGDGAVPTQVLAAPDSSTQCE